ncbi:MAG: hypothetical protein AB4040_14725 [Synechococcus sp.]
METLHLLLAQIARLETENKQLRSQLELTDSLPEPALPQAKGCGGYIEKKWICRNGKRFGPYLYLRWQENGKKKSKYLGKEGTSSPSLLTDNE